MKTLITFRKVGRAIYQISSHKVGDSTLGGELIDTTTKMYIPKGAVEWDQNVVGAFISGK